MPTKTTAAEFRADAAAARGSVLAVRHALQVLRCLSGEGPLGVSELASRVGLHKSSVSRLVATLVEDDLVERDADSRRVRLGAGLLSLSAPLLGKVRIADAARPHLADLAALCGETISLSIWDGAGAVNLEQALGARAVKHYAPPGSRNPAHCTASGKLLLAHAPPAAVERVVARGLPRYTPRTIVGAVALRGEIALIRRKGFALNAGEYSSDVGGLAAPVRDAKGQVVAAVTATVPMYRFASSRRLQLLDMLLHAADGVSERVKRLDAAAG
jgi:DNA-binding IclR family transcriptional regulator